MTMLEFMVELIEPVRNPAPSFATHVDDVLFCASAAGLLATPLLSAAASYF